MNTQTSATGTLREDAAIGTTVTVTPALAASDADKGLDHGTFHWEIVGGNSGEYVITQ